MTAPAVENRTVRYSAYVKSLSVAVLAGVVLLPAGATAASAEVRPAGTAVGKTFKGSDAKRAKRAARTGVVARPRAVTPVPEPVVVAPAPVPAPSYADRVLALTNAERTSRGLRALAHSGCADRYADSWAVSLAAAGALSHQPLAPILAACSARRVAENVAYGNVTPERLVQMWMDSPGHRANILNAAYTHLGVGDVRTSTGRVYGVQVFLAL